MANEKAARELKLWCFHQERLIGCFQPTLHTDIRTVVEALCRESTGRGRPITLSAERTAAVEAALHADGTHSSMAAAALKVRKSHATMATIWRWNHVKRAIK